MRILAIDLAKAKSLFCWYASDAPEPLIKTVFSTPAAFEQALTERAVDRVVIEVCDMAGWISDLCGRLSIPIQVANANGEAWRWKKVKTKTDRADALKLARMSLLDELELVSVPDRPTRQWRGLILYRHRLLERRTRVKNVIHALMVSEGKAMKRGKETWSPESLAKLRALAMPVEQCSDDQLWNGHLQLELEQLDELNEKIEQLDRKLDALGREDERVVRLQTIKGVGPRVAELTVAIIDDPHRFKNARQISAYAGLTPRRYQSGEMDRSGRISKAGCGKLRKLLLQSAWVMVEHNAHGRGIFARISKGQKTRRKQAAVALARRILVWSWAMLRDGTDWKEPSGGNQRRVGTAPNPA